MPSVNPTPYKYKLYFLLKKLYVKKKVLRRVTLVLHFCKSLLVSGLIDVSWISHLFLHWDVNKMIMWSLECSTYTDDKKSWEKPKVILVWSWEELCLHGHLLTSVVLDHTLRTAGLIKILKAKYIYYSNASVFTWEVCLNITNQASRRYV